ncbi:MAG TPA: GNAT family N-acetyltransferase [Trueperaceae bacterium]|nr:GNAT family N-acetyltransferase [Trueperaceae bacterium]
MSSPVTLPSDRVLSGTLIQLVPLTREHLPALLDIAYANSAEFRLTSTPVDADQAEFYFGMAFEDVAAGTAYVVAVLDSSGDVIGTTRLADLVPRHRVCELGYTWYDPKVFSSGVNVECKLLMLQFAFEEMKLNRVQMVTDTRNLRSQRAIRALGADYEGVLRRHKIAKDGYVRDSMVFAVTDMTWPTVKLLLTERLRRKLGQGGKPD